MNTLNDQFQKSASVVLDPNPTSSDDSPKIEDSLSPTYEPISKPGDFRDLFHFCNRTEKIKALIAMLLSMLQGILLPLITIIFTSFGGITSSSVSFEAMSNNTNESFKITLVLGGLMVSSSFISCSLWNSLSDSQTRKIKSVYLRKLLYQNTKWFDTQTSEEISGRYVSNVTNFGIVYSQKLHFYFVLYAQAFAGIFFCFYLGWLLSIAILLQIPFIFSSLYLYVKGLQKSDLIQKKQESKSTMLFENSISLIKPIKAINGEEQVIERFNSISQKMESFGIKQGYRNSLYWALIVFSTFISIGLSCMVGFKLIEFKFWNTNTNQPYSPNEIISILFSIMTPLVSFGHIGNYETYVKSAIQGINEVIEMANEDNKENHNGYKPESVKGEIVFENVTFSYPSDPKVKVLKNFNLKIDQGEKICIIGQSGCGKTTIVQLLERFYEPEQGKITLDGVDIKEYDIKFLRSKIGLVSQHSLLFSGSIRDNLAMGLESQVFDDDSYWRILDKVQATEFIRKLPKGLDTQVNNNSGSMSNGQKQKLCLARALFKSPSILLFDEATNSIDKQEEKEIRAAIDNVSHGCTSVLIEHKMGKIETSDKIYVLDHGVIIESGTPQQLLLKKDSYYYNVIEKLDEDAPSDDDGMDSRSVESLNPGMASSTKNIGRPSEAGLTRHDSKLRDVNISLVEDNVPKNLNWKPKVFNILSKIRWRIFLAFFLSAINGFGITLFGFSVANITMNLAEYGLKSKEAISTSLVNSENALQMSKSLEKSLDEMFFKFFILSASMFVICFIQIGLVFYITEYFIAHLRSIFFRKMIFLDLKFFDKREFHSGQLALGLNKQLSIIKLAINDGIVPVIQMSFAFFGGFLVCWYYSIEIALVGAVSSAVIVVFKCFESKFTSYYSMLAREMNFMMLSETLGNMRLVRSLNAEEAIIKQFTLSSKENRKKRFWTAWIAGFVFGLSQLINYVVYGLILIFGIKYGNECHLSIRDIFICFLTMVVSMYGTMIVHDNISNVLLGLEALKSLAIPLYYESEIEQDPEEMESPKRVILTSIERIEFKNVDFKYEGRSRFALRNLNLTFRKGQINGVFGKSASGKSAIIELLLRFYDHSGGQILVDDHPIQSINVTQLRSLFGAILQDTRLFNDTIDANIRGTKELSDQEVRAVAHSTNCLHFIFASPEGFKRVLSNFGGNLSGGQRQRLLLARFLGMKAKVSLLDEPTSALDSNNEKRILDLIQASQKPNLTVILSSKISPMGICDVVSVLSNGKVEEEGTLQELLDKKGRFYTMSRH